MAAKTFKLVLELDEEDLGHFRSLCRKAKKNAAKLDPKDVLDEARALVERVRRSKVPHFVTAAIEPLDDLIHLLEDPDYDVPKGVRSEIITALAYFAEPHDLIPDHIPVVGYLDDAIMTWLLEQEFDAELWGYRKFRAYRERAEQRPWTGVARGRLPGRLAEQREKLRRQVNERRKRKTSALGFDW